MNFSAADLPMVWESDLGSYMINRASKISYINDSKLKSAVNVLPRAYRALKIDGLVTYYERTGFPGKPIWP